MCRSRYDNRQFYWCRCIPSCDRSFNAPYCLFFGIFIGGKTTQHENKSTIIQSSFRRNGEIQSINLGCVKIKILVDCLHFLIYFGPCHSFRFLRDLICRASTSGQVTSGWPCTGKSIILRMASKTVVKGVWLGLGVGNLIFLAKKAGCLFTSQLT